MLRLVVVVAGNMLKLVVVVAGNMLRVVLHGSFEASSWCFGEWK